MLGAMQQVKVPDKFMTYITLFFSGRGYYPHFVDIIRILWISMFRGYYPHFVDIICIGHIMSYLPRNYRLYFIFTHLV